MIFLPLACSTAILPYYHLIENSNFEYKNVSLVAMDLGIYRFKDYFFITV